MFMQNQEVIKIIDNLKGRRKYEEKKATKLGFNSLYEYIEDKILKQKKAIEDKQRSLELIKTQKILSERKNKKKKSCGCC
ncbi:MAG: hypothetical protein CMP34_03295 [Rickettsiales bacterium]|nr:hypothetical protein [Rickettsiales bacterium]|tara:strand:- start:614 stop:853 length:240 start_codon:yes stop_codon:yes gene_type:complete